VVKQVLLSGATGFIGRRLCALLKERDVYVRAMGREVQDGP